MLAITIVKHKDGMGVPRCRRADGSETWRKQERHAAFFALHDLTHYAVETELGLRGGVFGLIAEGWEIEDTTGKGARGPLPAEAAAVESIVGLLDSERAGGELWSAREFSQYSPRSLTDSQLIRVRARRAELFRQWAAVEPGSELKLSFE